ncbi:MAG TPA: hypothetical protein VGT44_09395 [Ktedonobacteraceae bacterium]|nr:hypothetical protein [Ktedonobacteraceae bacterium]
MKLNGQSRSFVKQVQVDLLALGDADLFSTVHQWIGGSLASGGPLDVPEETRLALGYTRALPDVTPLAPYLVDVPRAELVESAQWYSPSPHHLRILITAMDVSGFAQHVITLAYQSLHPTHPEWYDGVTFNAHLANYLRQMRHETPGHYTGPRKL